MGKNSHTEGWARSAAHAAGTFFAGGVQLVPSSPALLVLGVSVLLPPCWPGWALCGSLGPWWPCQQGRRWPEAPGPGQGFRGLPASAGGRASRRRDRPQAVRAGPSSPSLHRREFRWGKILTRRGVRGLPPMPPELSSPGGGCKEPRPRGSAPCLRPSVPANQTADAKKIPHFSAFLSGLSPAPAQPYAPAPARMLHSLMIANRQTRGNSCGPVSPSLSLKLYLLTSQNAEGPHGPAACGSGSGAVGLAHGT